MRLQTDGEDLPGSSVGKNLPAVQENPIPCREDLLEKG